MLPASSVLYNVSRSQQQNCDGEYAATQAHNVTNMIKPLLQHMHRVLAGVFMLHPCLGLNEGWEPEHWLGTVSFGCNITDAAPYVPYINQMAHVGSSPCWESGYAAI